MPVVLNAPPESVNVVPLLRATTPPEAMVKVPAAIVAPEVSRRVAPLSTVSSKLDAAGIVRLLAVIAPLILTGLAFAIPALFARYAMRRIGKGLIAKSQRALFGIGDAE